MIGFLLPKAKPDSVDAADALAIAITHAHHRQATALRKTILNSHQSQSGRRVRAN